MYFMRLVYIFGTFEHTLCRGILPICREDVWCENVYIYIYAYTYNILYYVPMCIKNNSFQRNFFRKKTNGGRKY